MQTGDRFPAAGPLSLGGLIRNSWRVTLMLMLFALTCWEVNPGQVPTPDSDTATPEESVAVASAKVAPSE